MHPRRGLLILETKDWKLETVQRATRCQVWASRPNLAWQKSQKTPPTDLAIAEKRWKQIKAVGAGLLGHTPDIGRAPASAQK